MKYGQFVFWPVFAGVLAAAFLNGGKHAYQLMYIFCGVLLFSAVLLTGAFFSVRVRARLPRRHVVTGQTLRWKAAARSSFFLPIPALELVFCKNDHMEGPASVTLRAGRRRAEAGVEHVFTCRGTYTVGVARWRAYDYIALFRAGRRVKACSARLDVLPKVIRFDGVGFNRPQVECRAFLPTAHPEFDGIRPYENADTLRSIHWKLSSKAAEDEWIVKKTRGSIPMPVTVLIDMTALPVSDGPDARPEREDKLLETAFSLIYHLLSAGPVQAAVLTRSVTRYNITTKREFMEFYRAVGVKPFEDGEPAGTDEYEKALGGVSDGSALWVVSAKPDGRAAEILNAHLCGGGARAYWLYVPERGAATYKEQAALENVGALGVPAAVIEKDIRDALWVFVE